MSNSITPRQQSQQHKATVPIRMDSNKSYTMKMVKIYIIHRILVATRQILVTVVAIMNRVKVNLGKNWNIVRNPTGSIQAIFDMILICNFMHFK